MVVQSDLCQTWSETSNIVFHGSAYKVFIICVLIISASIVARLLNNEVKMKFFVVVCLLIISLAARETLAQDAGSGDGTASVIGAGLNLAGQIVQGLNRKFHFFFHLWWHQKHLSIIFACCFQSQQGSRHVFYVTNFGIASPNFSSTEP